MPELDEIAGDAIEKAAISRLNSVIAILVSIVATFRALCNVKDGNIVQAMEQAQARSIDQWSYYQAKGTKLDIVEAALEQLELQDKSLQEHSGAAGELLRRTIAEYKQRVQTLNSEKVQIKQAAMDAQREYDRLNFHDDQFDAADACLSIAIALFGVTALTQKRWLLVFACVLGALGVILGLAGFIGLRIHPDFLARILS